MNECDITSRTVTNTGLLNPFTPVGLKADEWIGADSNMDLQEMRDLDSAGPHLQRVPLLI